MIKLKNDLETAFKGSDAKDINDAGATIDETIEANFSKEEKSKKSIAEMLTFYKNEATHAKDQMAVKEIEKLEQELAAISEQPTSALELSSLATSLGNIKISIPQIKATLDKATTLKNIAEQVDDDFAKNFDNIIKEIEAADSVDKINLAEETLQNAEITLRGLMRKKQMKRKGCIMLPPSSVCAISR